MPRWQRKNLRANSTRFNPSRACVRGILFLLIAALVLPLLTAATPHVAYAAETYAFDTSNVMDDLKSSEANGQGFSLRNYPHDENGRVSIINFVEYCYMYSLSDRLNNFALYVYMYNPRGVEIDPSSGQNKIELAVGYDGSGYPSRYEKFDLKFCSKSEGKSNALFYKFRVIDKPINGTLICQRVKAAERRYDVAGVELKTVGATNATDYGVGGVYKFKGYAAGCGEDPTAPNSLTCTVENLDTVRLQLHHTNYRTGVSSLGANHYNNVDTVYFSVPDHFFKEYGNLQKIHAEWWEYKTKLAAVTSNEAFYQLLKQGAGLERPLDKVNEDIPYRIFTGYQTGQSSSGGHSYTSITYDWSFNCETNYEKTTGIPPFTSTSYGHSNSQSTMIPFVFYSPSTNGVGDIFDFLYSKPIAGDVTASEVSKYIYEYRNDLGHGYIDCNGRELSKDLFESYVDEGRAMGYNNVTIDFEDTFDLKSYNSNHSWIDKLLTFGFHQPVTDEEHSDVLPIYELKAADLLGSSENISSRLLVNSNDVEGLRAYYTAESLKGNHVILFRFANTDYYCQAAGRSGNGIGYLSEKDTDTYIASETVFLDFDIIDLTFNKDGVYRVIPAVSNPIDIINGLTAPPRTLNIWKLILFIIAAIAAVILLVLVIILFVKIFKRNKTSKSNQSDTQKSDKKPKTTKPTSHKKPTVPKPKGGKKAPKPKKKPAARRKK